MRLNALTKISLAVVGMLVASVAVAVGVDDNQPRQSTFGGEAIRLEPTPTAEWPSDKETVPEAAVGGSRRATSSDANVQRGQPRPRRSQVLSLTGQSTPAPRGRASVAQRLRRVQEAMLDPEVGSAGSEPTTNADASLSERTSDTPAPTAGRPQGSTRPIPNQAAEVGNRSSIPNESPLRPTPSLDGTTAASRLNRAAAAPAGGVLLSNTTPAITVAAIGPPTVVIGKAAGYSVTVTNRGDVAARDLAISVSVPNWIDVSSSQVSSGSPRMETDVEQNSVMKWQIRQLPPRRTERLDLRIIPRESRAIELSVQWGYAPAEATAQIEVQEPKLQMAVSGPEDVLYGDTKVFTITVSNPGTGTAENVVLNLLPVAPDAEAAGAREIGALPAGARKSIEIELTAHQAGRLQVRAHAFADGGLRAEASKDVMVRRANLEVAAVGPDIKYAGTSASYKIRVANTGDATAQNVVLGAVLPAGCQYVSSTDGGKIDHQKGQVSWQIGALRHGAVRIFDLQCVLIAPGENRLDIRTRAEGELSAAQAVLTTVEALADLKLEINDPPGAIPVGTQAEYEVRVVNRGSKAAEDIQIVGFFGRGVEPVSVQGWRGELSSGQVEFESIGRLNAGQELVFKILARADTPGTHRFRVELSCPKPDTKLASEESTRFYGEQSETPRQAMAQPHSDPHPYPKPLGPEPPMTIVR